MSQTNELITPSSDPDSINNLKGHNAAQWLRGDVEKTKTISMVAMLHALTQRICTDQNADTNELFKKILEITDDMIVNGRSVVGPVGEPSTTASSSTAQTVKAEEEDVLNAKERQWSMDEVISLHSQFVTAKNEAATYSPWVNMTNTTLELLRNKKLPGIRDYDERIDILLQHSDPSLLRYSHNDQTSYRKPDSIFMTLSTARGLHRCDPSTSWKGVAEKYATTSPTSPTLKNQKPSGTGDEAPLDWGDALSSVEYKRDKPQKVVPQSVNTFDEDLKDFREVLISEGISLPSRGKRKRTGDEEAQNHNATKSQKTETGASARRSISLTGPSHSGFSAESGSRVSQSTEIATEWTKSVAIQSAEYGLYRLCCSFDVTHTFTFILIDTTLYISWYDHEGIVTTSGFDVAKYLGHYLALLFILQRFDRKDWGRCGHPSFDTSSLQTKSKQFSPEDSQSNRPSFKDMVVTVNDQEFAFDPNSTPVHKVMAIGGRATSIWNCRMKKGDGQWTGLNYVIKFSWKEKTRMSEGEIMNYILKKSNGRREIVDYLPEFIAHEVFANISTEGVRKSIEPDSNPREFVVVVMAQLNGTVEELEGDDFWDVMWDCFECHYHLWKLGIRHQDISIGNLMYQRDPGTGAIIGKLIDFDLASTENGPSNNKQRTGTRPFMAIRLLEAVEPIAHVYKHDAESFFWVAAYVMTCCGQYAVRGCPMTTWGNIDSKSLVATKTYYLVGGSSMPQFWPHPHRAKAWKRWGPVLEVITDLAITRFTPRPVDILPAVLSNEDELYSKIQSARTTGVLQSPLVRAGARLAMPERHRTDYKRYAENATQSVTKATRAGNKEDVCDISSSARRRSNSSL